MPRRWIERTRIPHLILSFSAPGGGGEGARGTITEQHLDNPFIETLTASQAERSRRRLQAVGFALGRRVARLGLVTGTRVEAACFGDASPGQRIVLCTGLDPARARDAARRLVDAGCTALASVGTAGGLEPGVPPGAIVIAESVAAADGGPYPADARWRGALMARVTAAGIAARGGMIIGCDAPALGPEDKRRLHAATGAVCCDMESHAVAAVAAAAGVPFLALRAVADDADDVLPRAALAAIGADGETRIGALMAALVVRPADLPGMIRLALASRRALRGLRRVAALGGPLLALL